MESKSAQPRRGSAATRIAAALAVLLVAVYFLVPRRSAVEAAANRPINVLLIVADTLRADRLACYGYPRPTSPNIDKLARAGTRYERNHSQACWTLPSMISMMTGRSVVEEVKALPPQPTVLGEVARDAGFETAAFLTNQGLGPASGFQRGWETYHSLDNERADSLASSFVDWHSTRTDTRPWFGWVHFIDPHEPYEPDAAHDVFQGPRIDHARIEGQLRAAQSELEKLSPDPRTQSLEDSVARATSDSNRYDGEVLSVDDGVGAILAELERSGELEHTLVIFCADHGEMLYEQRQQPLITHASLEANGHLPQGVLELFGHGHRPWYYEHLWRTPLILAGPGMPANAVRSHLSENLDIFPTVLEALGLPARPELEGRSLWGGAESGHERVFAYGHRTSAVIESSGLKLIVHPPEMFLEKAGGEPKLELHDLASDPGELTDLAQERADDARRLLQEVRAWHARSPHYGSDRTAEEQLKVLKKLGYIEGDR
ncbi:MAG: sulfatase [Planctomycetes bacterium]|nr:sulfatase [Planctomycetota bacterium]